MKFHLPLCLALASLTTLTTMTARAEDAATTDKKAAKKEKKTETKKPKATKLSHVVAFKFKDGTSKEDIKKIEDAFRALKTKIPQVQKLTWGLNNSPEGFNKGFTHMWVLTFNSEEDRNAYLVHPDHKEFGKLLTPYLGDAFVFDFWGKD